MVHTNTFRSILFSTLSHVIGNMFILCIHFLFVNELYLGLQIVLPATFWFLRRNTCLQNKPKHGNVIPLKYKNVLSTTQDMDGF